MIPYPAFNGAGGGRWRGNERGGQEKRDRSCLLHFFFKETKGVGVGQPGVELETHWVNVCEVAKP